jgi:hypothetical protein
MALRTWTLPTLPKATIEDPNDTILGWTAQHTGGPTHLEAYAPYRLAPLAAVTRASGTTNTSATVTDSAITNANSGWAVTGAVPTGAYVGVVTPGTSYLMVNAVGAPVLATATASPTLTLTPPAFPLKQSGSIPTTAPAAPTMSTSTTGGTGLTASTVYTYSYAWLTERGESLPSATAPVTTGTGSTNSTTVTVPTWPAYAIGFTVYGRVAGTQTLLAVVTTASVAAGIAGATTAAFGTVAWIDTGVTSTTLANVGRKHSGNNEALALVTH